MLSTITGRVRTTKHHMYGPQRNIVYATFRWDWRGEAHRYEAHIESSIQYSIGPLGSRLFSALHAKSARRKSCWLTELPHSTSRVVYIIYWWRPPCRHRRHSVSSSRALHIIQRDLAPQEATAQFKSLINRARTLCRWHATRTPIALLYYINTYSRTCFIVVVVLYILNGNYTDWRRAPGHPSAVVVECSATTLQLRASQEFEAQVSVPWGAFHSGVEHGPEYNIPCGVGHSFPFIPSNLRCCPLLFCEFTPYGCILGATSERILLQPDWRSDCVWFV